MDICYLPGKLSKFDSTGGESSTSDGDDTMDRSVPLVNNNMQLLMLKLMRFIGSVAGQFKPTERTPKNRPPFANSARRNINPIVQPYHDKSF